MSNCQIETIPSEPTSPEKVWLCWHHLPDKLTRYNHRPFYSEETGSLGRGGTMSSTVVLPLTRCALCSLDYPATTDNTRCPRCTYCATGKGPAVIVQSLQDNQVWSMRHMSLWHIKSVSKVLGKMSDSLTSYIASMTISACANNFLSWLRYKIFI